MGSYIPARDADLVLWADNFRNLIVASPVTYALAAGDGATIAAYVNAYDAALSLAINPATRTGATIADKDGKRAAMIDIVRAYSQQIKRNLGVSNENKVSLGLNIDDQTPTPVPTPATNPLLSIVGATPLEHTLRFSDSLSPDSRGKPFGAIGMQLFGIVSETVPVGPSAYRFLTFATKQPLAIDWGADDVGKKAYYIARWQTRTGKVGPWSQAVGMTVAG